MARKSAIDYFKLNTKALDVSERGGYLYFHMPDHPLANRQGDVLVHRHVASAARRSWVTANEVVTFTNGRTTDIRPANLTIQTRSQTANRANDGSAQVELICSRQACGNAYFEFASHASRRRYCSRECAIEASRRFEISQEELEQLVWEMPTTHIAADFGVSSQAIAKRCSKFGVKKPARGYWAKLYSGAMDPTVEEELRNKRPPPSGRQAA